jgi:outer membrane protein TolC
MRASGTNSWPPPAGDSLLAAPASTSFELERALASLRMYQATLVAARERLREARAVLARARGLRNPMTGGEAAVPGERGFKRPLTAPFR